MGVTLCLSKYHILTVGVVVNVWVNLQLTMQFVPFTTNFVRLNAVHGEVYSIQPYVIKFVSDLLHDLIIALSRKSKDWFAQNQDNVLEWGNMSLRGLLFQ